MTHAETKQWLTPARLARGPEAAEAELKRWSMTAFRPAKLTGPQEAMPAALLTAARAQRAESERQMLPATLPGSRAARRAARQHEGEVGAAFMTARHPPPSAGKIAAVAIGSLAAVGVGFAIGRWWRKRHKPQLRVVGEQASNPYLIGAYGIGGLR